MWINDIQLGLGLWQGVYQGSDRQWLRWYDAVGNWVLTPEEREKQIAAKARRRTEKLAAQLRALGIEPVMIFSTIRSFLYCQEYLQQLCTKFFSI